MRRECKTVGVKFCEVQMCRGVGFLGGEGTDQTSASGDWAAGDWANILNMQMRTYTSMCI